VQHNNTSPTVPRLVRVESGHRIGGLWLGFTFVVHVRAVQKRHFVENMLLEPFEPEINHRRNKKCDHLRENQAPTMTRPGGRRKSADFVQPLDDLFILRFDGQLAGDRRSHRVRD
jgi:hypothetical protein